MSSYFAGFIVLTERIRVSEHQTRAGGPGVVRGAAKTLIFICTPTVLASSSDAEWYCLGKPYAAPTWPPLSNEAGTGTRSEDQLLLRLTMHNKYQQRGPACSVRDVCERGLGHIQR
jgi:hypothetical protein